MTELDELKHFIEAEVLNLFQDGDTRQWIDKAEVLAKIKEIEERQKFKLNELAKWAMDKSDKYGPNSTITLSGLLRKIYEIMKEGK